MSDDKVTTSIVPVTESSALVASLTHEFDFPGASGAEYEAYSVGHKPLVETKYYKILVVKLPGSGQLGLGMVASDPRFNYLIEKQQHILHTLGELAQLEDDEAKRDKPYYNAFFPQMIDTFDTGEDSARAGIVMGFHPELASFKQLVPLAVALKGKRVDLQTGTWMTVKALKLMDFVHAMGFAINWIDDTNYFIETDKHGVFVLNWMEAIEEADYDDQMADIKALAQLVWTAAGGTDKAEPPHDATVMSKENHGRFVEFLKHLMGDPSNAGEEMVALLALADTIWERELTPGVRTADGKKRPFHPYVTY